MLGRHHTTGVNPAGRTMALRLRALLVLAALVSGCGAPDSAGAELVAAAAQK